MTTPLEAVTTLAIALDEDDYPTAASVMAPTVEYLVGHEVLSGPVAIVESYRTASEMARRLFDIVGYDHEIEPTDDPRLFVIHYSDILTIGDETLTHMAEQHVRAEPGVGVVHITNIDVPGERERVDAFLSRHGRSR